MFLTQNGRDSIRKVLVCQQRQLGDVLLATPVLECLQARFPHWRIDFFTEKKCVPLLEHHPFIHKIWAADTRHSLREQFALYRSIRKESYHLVIALQHLPRCRLVTLFSGAPYRISYQADCFNNLLFTHTSKEQGCYAGARRVSVLQPLGIFWQGELPRMVLTAQERQRANTWLTSQGLRAEEELIALDVTHKHANRRWADASFAACIDTLAIARPQARFFFLCGPGEQEQADRVRDLCKEKESLLPLPQGFSLRESAAVLAEARLHIGGCSAPRHMAVALGVPTLAIVGASGLEWTAPSPCHQHCFVPGLSCHPCRGGLCPQGHYRCLGEVSPEAVTAQALDLLQQCEIEK